MMIVMVTIDCHYSSALIGRANVNNCSVSACTVTTSVIKMLPEGDVCVLQRSH